jgi:hypothetical protein
MIAEGQVHGGIAQGVAQALLERVVYDDDGNLTTSNFMDYQVISAVGHARRSRVCSPKYGRRPPYDPDVGTGVTGRPRGAINAFGHDPDARRPDRGLVHRVAPVDG